MIALHKSQLETQRRMADMASEEEPTRVRVRIRITVRVRVRVRVRLGSVQDSKWVHAYPNPNSNEVRSNPNSNEVRSNPNSGPNLTGLSIRI